MNFIRYLFFKFRMWRLGLVESQIGDYFRFLVDLDLNEFRPFYDEGYFCLEIFAIGGTVEIKSRGEHFVFSGENGQIHVQKWRGKKQIVEPMRNWKISTQWYSIYRSGSYVLDTSFLKYLCSAYAAVNRLRTRMSKELVGVKIPIEVNDAEKDFFVIRTCVPLIKVPGFIVKDVLGRGGEVSFLDAEQFLKAKNEARACDTK